MSHKYLKNLNGWIPHFCKASMKHPTIGIKRSIKWFFERRKYGFDSRETWDMNKSFYCWAYERLKMFLYVSNVDLESKETAMLVIGNQKETLKTWIFILLHLLKTQIEDNDSWTVEYDLRHDRLMEIFTKVIRYLWW